MLRLESTLVWKKFLKPGGETNDELARGERSVTVL